MVEIENEVPAVHARLVDMLRETTVGPGPCRPWINPDDARALIAALEDAARLQWLAQCPRVEFRLPSGGVVLALRAAGTVAGLRRVVDRARMGEQLNDR